MATTITYPANVLGINAKIINSDGTNMIDIVDNTAGTKAVRVEQLLIASDEATPNTRLVQFYSLVSAANYLKGSLSVVYASGSDGATAIVDALDTIGTTSPDGISVIHVPAGQKLQAKCTTTVTSGKTIHITGIYRSYE